ncbi:PspC domain-containing protein [Georgenia sp. H159]|uniref:PspC domain-containing protein n=1 Tax=Georgenia sp. H159 TaxID=3076115 RepID=UPI002D780A77|nr:PspC domain-containing protein [Georgenia sp. H159]
MNGQSAPHTPSPPPPSPPGGFFDSVRRLGIWRSQDRWGAGVAAGIAQRYGLDPILVRGLFVVATMFGGLGLVLYGVAWALLPEASDGRIHLEQAVRGHFDIALAGALAVLIIGLSRPVFWWSASWWAVPWVVVLAGIIAVVVVSRDGRTRTAPAATAAGSPGPSYPPPPHPGHPAGAAAFVQPDPTSTAADAAQSGSASRPAYDIPEDHVSRPPSTTGEPASPPGHVAGLLPAGAATEPLTASAPHGPDVTQQLPDDQPTYAPTEPLAAPDVTQQLPGDHPAAPESSTASADEAWTDGTEERAGWAGSGWGSGWGSGGGWNAGEPGTPGPPRPPVPVQPPVPGPGSRTTNLVLALSLLGAAGVALAHQQGALDGNAWLVGGGAVLTLLGLGVLVSGMRGRTQGGLGVLALLLALVMVPAAAATAALPGFARLGSSATTWAGDPTWAPTTADHASAGYSLVAGELVVDLSDLDADEDVTIPVGVTFGNLHLIVPEDGDVTVHASVGGGEVVGRLGEDWDGPGLPMSGSGEQSLTNGAGVNAMFSRDDDGRGPEIVVDAEVSFGQIHIEETS